MEVPDSAREEEREVQRPVRLDLDSAPTIGYASIQNSMPVVRSLRVTNSSDAELADAELLVRCDPGFAVGAKLRELAP